MDRLTLLQNLRKPLWAGVKLGSKEQTAMALMWQAANDICKLRDEIEHLRLRLLKGVVDSDLLKIYDGSALERADKYIEQLESELSAYRTAEEQGLLVRLPCKVGDEIFSFRWSIKNQKHEVCTGKVKNVRYDSVDSSVMVSDGEYYRVWGKTVFPTREEAEEALRNG